MDFVLSNFYNSLNETTEFNAAKNDFHGRVRALTADAYAGLAGSTGIKTEVADSLNWAGLFSKMDFSTKKEEESSEVSLRRQRGDGVQVRHLVEILAYTASLRAENINIIAFEEPENSLSISSQIEISNKIVDIASKENHQLFVTTHSPTFYSLESQIISKYFIYKDDDVSGVDRITVKNVDRISDSMGRKFLLPIVEPAYKEMKSRIADQEEFIEEFRRKQFVNAAPQILMEGPSDEMILSAALEKLYPDKDYEFIIENFGGAGKFKPLRSLERREVERLYPNGAFVLLDNDKAGREGVKFNRHDEVTSLSNGLKFGLIFIPDVESARLLGRGIKANSIDIDIEDLISSNYRIECEAQGLYKRGDFKQNLKMSKEFVELSQLNELNEPILYDFPSDSKMPFARRVAKEASREDLLLFQGILSNIIRELTPTA